jgi:hypothetical protein
MHNEEPLMASNLFTKEIESYTWIYESPDQGKTVHRRLVGSGTRKIVKTLDKNELQDKLGIDILEKVAKLIGE